MSVTPPPFELRPTPFAPTALGGVLSLLAAEILAVFAWLYVPLSPSSSPR
jgi:hypothetical protein